MPKVNIGDIDIYYRIFRNNTEFQVPNENELASSYLSESGAVVKLDKPLKPVGGIKVVHVDSDWIDTSLPTMVMLPGGPGFIDHSMYLDFWASLSDVIQVVMLDQRGNGRSDRGNPDLWNMDVCARDVVKFCDALKIQKPLVAGVSWGGYVAMHYASRFPKHPGALILMHTEAKVDSDMRQAAFAARAAVLGCIPEQVEAVKSSVWAYDHTPNKPGVREAFITNCWGKFYGRNPYQPEDFARCVTNIPMREKFATEENLQFDFRDELSKIICPVWYVAGELDPAHPYQCAKEAASLMNNVKLSILKGLGAPVYRDDPAGVSMLTKKAITKMLPLLSACDHSLLRCSL